MSLGNTLSRAYYNRPIYPEIQTPPLQNTQNTQNISISCTCVQFSVQLRHYLGFGSSIKYTVTQSRILKGFTYKMDVILVVNNRYRSPLPLLGLYIFAFNSRLFRATKPVKRGVCVGRRHRYNCHFPGRFANILAHQNRANGLDPVGPV